MVPNPVKHHITKFTSCYWQPSEPANQMCSKKTLSETAAQRCSVKKVFFEISQNLQENTSARASFLNKVAALGLQLC